MRDEGRASTELVAAAAKRAYRWLVGAVFRLPAGQNVAPLLGLMVHSTARPPNRWTLSCMLISVAAAGLFG